MLVASHLRHTARRLARHAVKAASHGLTATALLLAYESNAAAQGNPYMAADLSPTSSTSVASFAVPSVLSTTPNSAYTMEAWVNLGTASSGIAQLGQTGSFQAGVFLQTNFSSGQHTLQFGGRNPGTPVQIVSGGTFAADTWTHVAATWTTGSTVTVYVNGSGTAGSWGGDAAFGYSTGNTFGTIDNAGSVTVADGAVSGLRVWETVRTSSELTTNEDITTDLSGQSGLLLNYAVGSSGFGPLTQGLAGSTTNALTISGSTTSNLIYTKYGSANLTTDASTTYDSSIAIAEGTLTLGSANQMLDSGTLAVDGNGSLDLNGFSDTVGAVTLTSGSIVNGTLTGTSFTVDAGTISAVLAGSGTTLTKSTAGLATLSAVNTYTGGTSVAAGTLVVTADGALGTTATGTTVASGATLDLNSVSYTTTEGLQLQGGTLQTSSGTSSFAGAIEFAATSNVDVAAGATLALSGNMSETGGSFGLTKTGTGSLTISGSSLTNTGLTSVNSGELVLNATLPGSVTVASGADLYGSMTVNGTTTIDAGATLSVGTATTAGSGTFGSLVLNGDTLVNFASGIDAGTATAGVDFDTLVITTSLTYGGDLNLNFAGAITNNDAASFSVFQITPTTTSDFTNVNVLASGSSVGSLTFNAGSGNWTGWVDLGFGDNQQLITVSQGAGTLQVVPEPSSFALAGFAIAGLAAAGYRRRKAAAKKAA